jgi:hypothetical protein
VTTRQAHAGRDFAFSDAGRSRVALISKSLAQHYYPQGDALGKQISIDKDPRTGGLYGDDQPYEVVGVVETRSMRSFARLHRA